MTYLGGKRAQSSSQRIGHWHMRIGRQQEEHALHLPALTIVSDVSGFLIFAYWTLIWMIENQGENDRRKRAGSEGMEG